MHFRSIDFDITVNRAVNVNVASWLDDYVERITANTARAFERVNILFATFRAAILFIVTTVRASGSCSFVFFFPGFVFHDALSNMSMKKS